MDGSSSVNQHQFEIMRLCIRQLVEMFPADQENSVRIGLIQFDSAIKIECPLKSNMQDVKCSITGKGEERGERGGGERRTLPTKLRKLLQFPTSFCS